ncbi:MAG: Ig-like domain-containing protein, partial [Hyphomicrobium sp.]
MTITGSASAITAALSGLAFAPTADWNGATTLNVSTSDGLAPAAVNAVAITVAPVVDIATDSVTVTEDVSQTFNVLTNDSFENAGATVSSVTQPTHGVVSIGSGGNVTYTPSANYNGSDSFTYTVTSGGVTETTTVTLNVTAVNDAPVADDETGTATEDTTLTVPAASGLLVGDTDADNNPLTITQFTVDGVAGTFVAGSPASIPNVGTLTINADGSYTFVPASNFNGPVPAATYTVSDNNGGFDTGTLTLAVTAVNDAPVAVDDTGLAEEDTLLSVSNVAGLLSNDGDVDSSPLTITQFTVAGVSGTFTAGSPASIPSVGVLTINSDGSYTFNPALDYIGAVPVATYTVSDGNGGLDTGTLTIAVNPANDGPVNAVPGAQTVAEDVATAITGVSVSDIDGGTLTTTLTVTNGTLAVTLGGGATITGSGTGTITLTGTAAEINSALDGLMFTGTADYSGPAILTVQTSDGIETDTDTVAITVTPVADITADTVATTEDSSISFNVLTGTNGATADTFEGTPSVTAYTQPANGTVTIAANGSVVYVPNANFNGTDTFTYTVTSGGVTETTTVTVNVAAANDAPAQTLPGDQSTSEDTNVVFSGANGNQIIIADIDAAASVTTTISVPAGSLTALATAGVTITGNATGTVTLTGAPAAVTAALNGLTYTPVADYNGAITMSVSTTDGVAAPVSGTVDIDISPVVDIQADTLLATEDTAATISVLSNDTFENAGRTVTSVTQGSNGSVAINGNGTITYVPNANFNGTDSFTYTVTSGGVTETVTVSVVVAAANDAVTQSVPASQTVVEDAALTFSAANGNAITVADIDGDSLTTTISVTNGVIDLGSITGITVSGDGTATVVITGSAAAINAALEGMTYSPVADYYGAAGMTVSTTDGATTASGTVPLAITAVVDISDDAQTTGEDTAIVFNVLSNDSFEGSSEFVSAVTQPANGSVSIGAGGQITYTPNANFNGTDTFTYTVTSGGVTETATVEVIVTPANDALIASVPSAQSVNEDTPLVFSSSNGNAITVSDIDGDTINMTLSATNGVLTLAATAGLTITGDGTGTITLSGSAAAITAALEGLEFAPDADYNGAAVLSISATDGTATTSQTVPVTINAVADIVANTVSTNEDTAVTFNALANDSFESSGRAVTSVTQGASGSVSFLADGTLVYTPNTNFHGVDTFSYTVTSNGTTETTTVTVNVAAVNDAPTTTGITNVSNVDGATVLIDVTSSFADVDSGDVLTYTASGLPAGLLIDSATGVISGTIDKNASQSGPYTVAVTASDGNPGGTVSTSFTWTVTNPGPTANNDAITVAEDAAPTTISVLANDTDPDGDALSVTGATASNGTVSILAGGTISYQPAANFNGTDTIVYQISDGNGGVSTATVTVTVTAVNDAPVADNETNTTSEDTTLTVPAASGLLVGDTDADNNPLTITQFTVDGVTGTFTAGSPASIPNVGTLTINIDGSYTFV